MAFLTALLLLFSGLGFGSMAQAGSTGQASHVSGHAQPLDTGGGVPVDGGGSDGGDGGGGD